MISSENDRLAFDLAKIRRNVLFILNKTVLVCHLWRSIVIMSRRESRSRSKIKIEIEIENEI